MAYIRIDKDQPQATKLLELADELSQRWQVVESGNQDLPEGLNCHVIRHALLGALVTLWCYADTHIRSDDSLPLTLSSLCQIVNLPVTVLEMFPPEWLTVREEDSRVVLPGYCLKNSITGREIRKSNNDEKRERERLLARTRQQKHRDKLKAGSNGVTNGKNGRDTSRVTGDTGTGTGTLDLTGTETPGASLAAGRGAAAPRKSFEAEFAERFATPPAAVAKKVTS